MKKLSLQEWRARPRNAIAMYPAMYTMEYLVTKAGEREYGAKLQAIITVFTEKEYETLLNSKEDYEKIGKLLVLKFKKNPSYLQDLIVWSENKKNYLYDFMRDNLNAGIIESLKNNQIADRYSEYVDRYLAYHLKNTPSWWVAPPAIENEVRDYFLKASIADIDQVLATTTEPLEYQMENFLEEVSILNMAARLKKIGINQVRVIEDMPDELQKDFRSHIDEFGSIAFGYNTGVVWDENYFIASLNSALKDNPAALKKSKLESIHKKIIRRDKLLLSLNLPLDIYNLIIALRQVSYLQELKKTTQTKSHPILQLVVKKEIANRIGIKKEYMDYLTLDEIIDSLKSGNVSEEVKMELQERAKFCVHIIEENKRTWLLGDEAKKFIKINGIMAAVDRPEEIKGSVASKGKITGVVRICESSTEINKVKRGDILVTAMTTPDFVPAMRRAAAIITDEGGITCHAAIISRELGKPCIIGTKIATKVLKDGDLVEVDANRGVVRRYQRNFGEKL